MKVPRSKFGVTLAGPYLVFVVAAIILAQMSPAEGEGSGLLAFYLTLPFSLILSIVLEVVRAGSLGSSLGLVIVLGVSAAINAIFLYFLGAALGRRSGTGGRT